MITTFLYTCMFTALSILIYKHMKKFNYWKEKGIFYPKPKPFFGNTFDIATFRVHAGEAFQNIYDQFDEPYIGFYFMDQPILLLKDPRIIKRILIKDFSTFRDRTLSPAGHSEIFRNFLLMARSGRWKELRNQLTPLFTSEKLKNMTTDICKVSDNLLNFISNVKGPICTKEIYTSFMTEAIANCFFKIETKCLEDENSIFREILRRLFHPSWKTLLTQLLYFVRPSWVVALKLDFVDSTAVKYLIKVFSDVIALRKGYTPSKPKDIIDLMIVNKNKYDKGFGKTGHFASGVQFFVAGIETTSTGLSWFFYELAIHQEIQKKLREEIILTLKRYNGEVTWQAIAEMKFLNMCYLETLRRHPFIPFLDREAMEDYEVEETGFLLEKGTHIFIPIFALSMDEKYFPEPHKFIPERFADSPHAFANTDGLVYIPFGAGQRICLGERFAIISSKLVICKTLLSFEILPCESTPKYPPKYNPRTTFLEAPGGLPVTFKKIDLI